MVNIAVYTIALNEEKHVERWAESAKDADLIMLADTGSTDDTVKTASELGVAVERIWIAPWRFDIARNAALALLPADIDVCIKLDVDEVLTPGWREALDKVASEHPDARRFSYHFVWNWLSPGVPDVQFTTDNCHSREGWKWHGAVHEVLVPSGNDPRMQLPTIPGGFSIEHHADNAKSRASYLPLLELAVREEPHNPRQRFYLGREYYFQGQWDTARRTLVEFLAMPEALWDAERAEAYRLISVMDSDPERWLIKALAEAPGRRDAVVDLVDFYERENRLEEAAGMAARALRISERHTDYMSRAHAWDDDRLRQIMDRVRVFD